MKLICLKLLKIARKFRVYGFLLTHPVLDLDSNTFVSEFRNETQVISLMVNRDRNVDENVQMVLRRPNTENLQWFDLYHGQVLEVVEEGIDEVLVNVNVEAGGYGAILGTTHGINEDFLNIMNELTQIPLRNFSSDWIFLPQTGEPLVRYTPQADTSTTSDMIEVPGGELFFNIQGNAIEGDDIPHGVDVQYPWEDTPRRHHIHTLEIPTMLVDKYPVTNQDYLQFLSDSQWIPEIKQNWLKDWINMTQYPVGYDKKPVTWVSHDDATHYCNFYGKRLPHSWEWQWFAQGPDARPWPWGWNPDETKVPKFTQGRQLPPADDVDTHPQGSSWCGIEDLVGNVYQWTDVFTDDHTSRAVLRGSPHWRPAGSHWYQPIPNTPLMQHNTYLLMSEGMDRNGGIGFRCVKDL